MSRISIFMLALLLLGGCQSKKQNPSGPNKQISSGSQSQQRLTPKQRRQLKKLSSLPFVLDDQALSASHILISYKGAQGAGSEIDRSKSEAAKRATEIHQKLVGGADFEATAREYSDCSTKNNGGNLGTFRDQNKFSAFNKAVRSLETGAFSEPIETSQGFHIVKRNKTEKVYTRHILIMHQAIKKRPRWVKRSKKAAKALAQKLREDIKTGSAKFADLAKKYSDCSSSQCGGKLKPVGRFGLLPKFEETAFKLKYWQLSPVIETRFGYHIIQRVPESFALADKKQRQEQNARRTTL